MKAVVQRVSAASVQVDGAIVGAIDAGVLVLLGVGPQDTDAQAQWLASKIAGLRIFEDEGGKMNLSLLDLGHGALVVSQFTLYGDCRKGRRPSFAKAGPPELANRLYSSFCTHLSNAGVSQVETGTFRAMMAVSLINDGPVTLILESP